jgi:superfamily II DNA/RNA helicase
VCSHIAARGLDVPNITHVIQVQYSASVRAVHVKYRAALQKIISD